MAKKITTIPATKNLFNSQPIIEYKKKKVAGYARVSTDNEEQLSSYEAQKEYYTNYIKGNPDWEFAGMYADEGKTGTLTKVRQGFNDMVDAALAGKIDLIITKSCSRFARNTVDSLVTVRKLKEKGVEIYFEKENIWTLDAKGELLITIMSSLAQEESRSISENTTWGKRKQFADGKVSIAYSSSLGYDKGPNGEFVINEEEAKIVRLIFKLYLQGYSCGYIKKELEERGIKSPKGKDTWTSSTIARMLSNEKYKGDALLQKEYTVDFLTKKKKKNEGELPQYYVKDHHEPIISPEEFDLVQIEINKRSHSTKPYHSNTIYGRKIYCGECGCCYIARVWHSTDKYRRTVYQCSEKYSGSNCHTPYITENMIRNVFIKAFNKYYKAKDELLENMDTIIAVLCNTEELEGKADSLKEEIDNVANSINALIEKNKVKAISQTDYMEKYEKLVKKYESKKAAYDDLLEKIKNSKDKALILQNQKKILANSEGTIKEFDEALWCGTVDRLTVYDNDNIVVKFKDGTEI